MILFKKYKERSMYPINPYPLYNKENGCVRRYMFSNNVLDTSGSGQNGTISGTPSYVADRKGNSSSAMHFPNSTSSYVTIPTWSFVVGTSISLWIDTSLLTTSSYYFFLGTSNSIEGICTYPNGTELFVPANTGLGPRWSLGSKGLKHIVLISTSGGIVAYINGTYGSYGNNVATTVNLNINKIGKRGGSLPYYGKVDDVRFYNRLLNSADVEALYNE